MNTAPVVSVIKTLLEIEHLLITAGKFMYQTRAEQFGSRSGAKILFVFTAHQIQIQDMLHYH